MIGDSQVVAAVRMACATEFHSEAEQRHILWEAYDVLWERTVLHPTKCGCMDCLARDVLHETL